MSPKRVSSDGPVDPGSVTSTMKTTLDRENSEQKTNENLAETTAFDGDAEGVSAADAEAPAKPTPPRSTSAAQAANRARRIGGSAVRPAGNGSAAVSTATSTRPESADPAQSGGVEAVKSASLSLTKSDDVPESPRKRGMKGRPGAKARVERVGKPVVAETATGRFRLGVEAIIALVLAVVAVALAVVNVLVWHPWQHTDKTAQLRGQILSSVNQATALVLTYDYRKWDASAAAAEAYLTGQFKIDYSNAMTGSLKGTATSTQTVVVGKVDKSGLVSINSKGTQATVAVYAERSKTNTSNTDPTVDLLAIQVTANKVNGKWLIGALSYID